MVGNELFRIPLDQLFFILFMCNIHNCWTLCKTSLEYKQLLLRNTMNKRIKFFGQTLPVDRKLCSGKTELKEHSEEQQKFLILSAMFSLSTACKNLKMI